MKYKDLHHISIKLELGQPLTQEQHDQLCEALNSWRRGQSLSDAFEIKDNAQERRKRRDEAIRDYGDMLKGCPWTKAEAIAADIQRIKQKRRFTNAFLVEANQIYKLPETVRQIYNIIISNTEI